MTDGKKNMVGGRGEGRGSVGGRGDALGAGKKEMVGRMFDGIAPTYDVLNHVLSVGIDKLWRKRVVRMAEVAVETRMAEGAGVAGAPGIAARPRKILDVATGTGDLAVALARRIPTASVVGVDISEGMLALGREKVAAAGLAGLAGEPAGDHGGPGSAGPTAGKSGESGRSDGSSVPGESGTPGKVVLQRGDAEALDFADGEFDVVTVAFGVRNFGDIAAGIGEMCRVLRPGGRCLVLEFSEPDVPVMGWMYRLYFHRMLPLVGRMVSRDKEAYSYLPRSVDGFPAPADFAEMLVRAGFGRVRRERLSGGIAYIYEAEK